MLAVSDDIYEHIYWGDEPWLTPAQVWTGMQDRIVTINGVSKAFAMTGWRIGYAALEGDQSILATMRNAFRERYEYMYEAVNALPGMRCPPAQGAFYVFADAREAIRAKGLENDTQMAELILSEAEVALVPGAAFGAEGHLRFSFACSMDDLREAVSRIGKLLA